MPRPDICWRSSALAREARVSAAQEVRMHCHANALWVMGSCIWAAVSRERKPIASHVRCAGARSGAA